MGDNRDRSLDSRFGLGFVPIDRVIGKAEFVIWPFEDIGGIVARCDHSSSPRSPWSRSQVSPSSSSCGRGKTAAEGASRPPSQPRPAVPRVDRRPSRSPRIKALLLVGAVWLVSPIDLIPEFLPGIGGIDDAIVAALILRHLVRRAGDEVVREHWGDPKTIGLILRVAGVGNAGSAT